MASRTKSLLRRIASLREGLKKNAKSGSPDLGRDLNFHRLASDLPAGCVEPAVMEETIGLWHLLCELRGPGSRIAQETILNALSFAPCHIQMEEEERFPRNESAGQLELNLETDASALAPTQHEDPGPPKESSKAAKLLADEALRFTASFPGNRSSEKKQAHVHDNRQVRCPRQSRPADSVLLVKAVPHRDHDIHFTKSRFTPGVRRVRL
jgi:hypothetical protein